MPECEDDAVTGTTPEETTGQTITRLVSRRIHWDVRDARTHQKNEETMELSLSSSQLDNG